MRELFLTKKFNIESQYGIRRPTYPPYDRMENIARRLETTLHDLTYRLGESLFCFYLPKLQRRFSAKARKWRINKSFCVL
jgi:hypothetical protein